MESESSSEQPEEEAPNLLSVALIFYTVMGGVGVIWAAFDGRSVFYVGDAPNLVTLLPQVGMGIGFGLAVVLLSNLSFRYVGFARDLVAWFRELLGPISPLQVAALALLSGFAEEMFFRGALQPAIGLWPAAVVFAVMHWPVERKFLWWTASTFVLGVAFGYAADYFGTLAAPIAAHFTINLINLGVVAREPPAAPD